MLKVVVESPSLKVFKKRVSMHLRTGLMGNMVVVLGWT